MPAKPTESGRRPPRPAPPRDARAGRPRPRGDRDGRGARRDGPGRAAAMIADLVMFAWIPAVILLMRRVPARAGVVAAYVVAWLFLPVIEYPLPGLPDYSKATATNVGVLLAAALAAPGPLRGFRPRPIDLTMLAWCALPFASSMANDLGPYDGLSASLATTVTWGLPYLTGRVYLGGRDGLRALGVGFVAGGLAYAPLCLLEMRISPQLHAIVYGIQQFNFTNVERYGGYRPVVFLKDGLETGMWMAAAALAAAWLWAGRSVRDLAGYRAGPIAVALVVVMVLCRSTGAILLFAAGVLLFVAVRLARSPAPLLALALVPPAYMATRASGLWSGSEVVEVTARYFGADRAQSLEFRLDNENMLVAKAMQRPVLGWGGWGRSRIYDDAGKDICITDGMWIIYLGTHGACGAALLCALFLSPALAVCRRFPARQWTAPEGSPHALFATLLVLYLIDSLSNSMPNPIYFLAVGAVLADGPDPDPAGTGAGVEAGAEVAGRARRLASAANDPEGRRERANACNDLAWSLARAPGSAPPDLALAAEYAGAALAIDPEASAYWNTLGVVLLRRGDWEGAARAIERSADLAGDASAYDRLYLAVAAARLGRRDLAGDHLAAGLALMGDADDPDLRAAAREALEAIEDAPDRPSGRGGGVGRPA